MKLTLEHNGKIFSKEIDKEDVEEIIYGSSSKTLIKSTVALLYNLRKSLMKK